MKSIFNAVARTVSKGLSIVKPSFQPDHIESLEQLYSQLPKVRFDHDLRGIEGWLSPNERKALYALARWLQGPFLEVGPWVGLSTTIIAYGIKDSRKKKEFVTAELNPRIQNFRPFGGGIGFFVPEDAELPFGVCPRELFEREMKPVLLSPGGVMGILKENLACYGLIEMVRIFEGDFRNAPNLGYKFIFSDTMHDPQEISFNAPALQMFISPGTVLACHDINATNEKSLRQHLKFGFTFNIDSLFVGEVVSWD